MNSTAWKFNDLKFPRPDFNVFKHLYEDAIEKISYAQDGDDIIEIMFEVDELSRKITDVLTATMIHHTMDITDERYENDQRWFEENQPLFMSSILDFNEAISNSKHREYIEEQLGPMYFVKNDIKKTYRQLVF